MHGKPRICFVGSMLGQNAGYVTTQGQITSELFMSEGYEVVCTSGKINRISRLLEIASVLIKKRHHFDIVLLEVYSGLGFILADVASLLCKMLKLPLIMVLHGGGLPEFIQRNPRWTKRVLKRANSLAAPSPFLAHKVENFGLRATVIPNVIELDRYPFKERSKLSPRLVWMRSFHPIYNPEMAVMVLAELQKTVPTATLTMAGVDKGLEPEIKKLVVEMNLSAAVDFPGFLDAKNKAKIFAESDIYLNTNRIDNMPVSIVEARAFGLPVVSTEVGGLPFLVSDGEDGLLVENENSRQMADAIKVLLRDANLAKKISRAGRISAERSAWPVVREQWKILFADVVGPHSKINSSNFFEKRIKAGN